VDALRSWERNGLVSVDRDANGFCRYERAALHRAEIVRALRTAGYSSLAILRMFREHRRGNVRGMRRALETPARGAEIVYVSDRWRATLTEHRQRARRILRQLELMGRGSPRRTGRA
jgi:DNA-binding transcriptional MerR regulator